MQKSDVYKEQQQNKTKQVIANDEKYAICHDPSNYLFAFPTHQGLSLKLIRSLLIKPRQFQYVNSITENKEAGKKKRGGKCEMSESGVLIHSNMAVSKRGKFIVSSLLMNPKVIGAGQTNSWQGLARFRMLLWMF